MTLAADIAKISADAVIFHDIANGDASDTITTEGGEVDTVARAISKIGNGNYRGAWAGPGTVYAINDTVAQAAVVYRCITGHTSAAAFVTDAANWVVQSAEPVNVTNAQMADMAQATIKGRASGAGTGKPVDLTPAQARTASGITAAMDAVVTAATLAAGRTALGPWSDIGAMGVFNIIATDYGADSTGFFDSTAALQDAIDDADAAGGGTVYCPPGTYIHGELTLYPGVTIRGDNRENTILKFNTATASPAFSGGADLSRVCFENLRLDSIAGSTGWCIYLATSTVRQFRMINCAVTGYLYGVNVWDAIHSRLEQVYFSGRGIGSGEALRLGNSPAASGTTWNCDGVYITSYLVGLRSYASYSVFEGTTIESCGTGIISYAPQAFIGVWGAANTTLFSINTNGVYIQGYRPGDATTDFVWDNTDTEARSTVITMAADTAPADGPNYKLQGMRIYRDGKILIADPTKGDFAGNLPVQSTLRGAINIDGTSEAERKIAGTRNVSAGAGQHIYIEAGGSKAGETDTDGGDLYLSGGVATGAGRSGIIFKTAKAAGSGTGDNAPADRWGIHSTGMFYPVADNTYPIGQAGNRATAVWAVNGTIQTSDRREKQDIQNLSEAERRVAVRLKSLVRTYRFKDDVSKDSNAKIRCGVIAQEVQEAFTAEGLDHSRYAMISDDYWVEKDGKVVDRPTGEEGEVIRNRLGVNYSDLMSFIISTI